jgi:DNA repair protein RadA/Sms
MSYFICNNCGYGTASWMGRCPDCNEWNTFVERHDEGEKSKEGIAKLEITPLTKVQPLAKIKKKTGLYEVDRVLGGGLVAGEVILLTGEPGVGKSTLLLQALQNFKTVYISGEEAAEQVKERASRLTIKLNHFLFSNTLQIEGIVEGIEKLEEKIEVLVIDSIQTVYSKDIESPQGSVSQIKEAGAKLVALAKKKKIAVIVVGHITKEGEIAGPKTLEHLVDCVLSFEGERVSNFRLLRASKNRFGPTDEIGIFEMRGQGLSQVSNPLVFLEEGKELQAGKAVVGVIEGKRPLFFEIQTLAVPTVLAIPRRVVKGLDYNKVLLLLAVARKHLGMSLDKFDIYVNVIGGINIKSTASDLGFLTSLLSSLKGRPIPRNSVFIGEVGLLGETRSTYFVNKVFQEAKRLGFKHIYSPLNIKNIKEFKTKIF